MNSASNRPAVFVDKDGTIAEDLPPNIDPGQIRLTPHAAEGLRDLRRSGYALIVVTNQPGIARGLFLPEVLDSVRRRIELLAGIVFDGFYYCPHDPDGVVTEFSRLCNCRKPAPGLLFQAALELGVDLARSWCIGDILHDVEAGNRAGCTTVLLNNGHETEWEYSPARRPAAVARTILEAAMIILQQGKPR